MTNSQTTHDPLPLVSVIIPCRNERSFIRVCLESVVASDYPKDRLEVLVIDGASDDGTVDEILAVAERAPYIRLLNNPGRLTPVALNLGIAAARGEIIVRIDAHARICPDYISRAVAHLLTTGADNVGGVMHTVPQSQGPFAKAIAAGLSHPFGVGDSYFRISSSKPRWVDTVFGGCYRRDVFDRVGLFNERLVRSQDFELNLRLKRAGGRILLAPDVVSYYYARSDMRTFWKHNFSNGLWTMLPLLYSAVIPISMRHLVPLGFVAALALLSTLSAIWPWFAWPLAAVIITYAVLNVAATLDVAILERNLSRLALMPCVFTSLHLSYGCGALWGAFRLLARGQIFKRIFDVSLSLLGVALLWPVLALIALAIRAASPGPVLYRGVRAGRHGRPFRILKFRTMIVDAEKLGASSTPEDDPRVSGVGRILRRYKLDELPQLFNVLKGDMSMVGPRPQVTWIVDLYDEWERELLTLRPGITDYASLVFRDEGGILRGSTDPDCDYFTKIAPGKTRLALEYIRHHSVWIDFKIVVATVGALCGLDPSWCLPTGCDLTHGKSPSTAIGPNANQQA